MYLRKRLFEGERGATVSDPLAAEEAVMHGFLKEDAASGLKVSNRIFETFLYDQLLFDGMSLREKALLERDYLLPNGRLNMRHVLERFSVHYNELFARADKMRLEEDARRLFLTFLRPLINDTGNYYAEAQTRDSTRTDIIVDYLGARDVLELKMWHGSKSVENGERQLADYLDHFNLDHGYLLVFSNLNHKDVKDGYEKEVDGKRIFVRIV
jgi:hypothetical protein